MKLGKMIKISALTAIFINAAIAAEQSGVTSLNKVEITSKGDYMGVDDAKVAKTNAGLLNDILRDIPGVYVGGTNGHNQNIYIRGMSNHALNVTVDGAKQKGNVFHHIGNLIIDTELLKAVEIESGARSVTRGSGALGGSVAFKTVDASDLLEEGQRVGAKIKTGYASNNDEFSQSLTFYALPIEKLDLLASIGHKDYSHGKSGNGKKIGGTDGNDISYLFKVGYSPMDSHRLVLSHQYMRFAGKYPFRAEFGANLSSQNADVNDRKFERSTSTIKYSYTPSDLLKLDVSAYATRHQRISPNSTTAAKDKWGVETSGFDAKATTKLATGALSHVIKYGFESYKTENFNKPLNYRPESVTNYSLYLEDAVKVASSGLTVTPGIRYEDHELETYHGISAGISKKSQKFDDFSPALALDYDFGRGFGAFASYAKIFRAPDVMESLYASGMTRGKPITQYVVNDNLKATTGDSYEIGGRYKGKINEDSSLNLVVKLYRAEYKNLIYNEVKKAEAGSMAHRINIGGAEVKGIELWTKLAIQNLSLSAGYTHQKVSYSDRLKNDTGSGYRASYLLGYRDQGDKYTFNTEYAMPEVGVLLGYRLLYMAKRNTSSARSDTVITMPGYSVSDFYITYTPNDGRFKGFELNAGLYNAFNKAYASHSQRVEQYDGDYPAIDWEAGRSFRASVSYKF